jgi:hypothetical protein
MPTLHTHLAVDIECQGLILDCSCQLEIAQQRIKVRLLATPQRQKWHRGLPLAATLRRCRSLI